MRIAVDAMGGDNAPSEIVKGCVEACRELDGRIILVGKEDAVKAELEKYKGEFSEDKIMAEHAEEVIENDDGPVRAVRSKPESSLVKAMNMVRDGKADAMLSAGNTGALMAAALFNLGRIKGIYRPAIVSAYPLLGRRGDFAVLVDSGANAECKPSDLLGFAYMGEIYMQTAFDIPNPKVGLINIGVEETKGTTMLKETYRILKASDLNFIGNVEARDIPRTDADVLVCDGFTGNVVVKLTEGVAWSMLKAIKEKITGDLSSKLAAFMLRGKFNDLKRDFDYSTYGGAPILGVEGLVFKMHGSSSSRAVKNAVLRAAEVSKDDIVKKIAKAMEGYASDGAE